MSADTACRVVALSALFAVAGCADAERPTAAELGVVSTHLTAPACTVTDPATLRVDTLATGMEVPWDVAFPGDGRALVTERSGRIRVITDEGLEATPWAEIDVYSEFEAGLLGLDVDPATGAVYVAGTFQERTSNGFVRGVRAVGRRLAHLVSSERGHSTWLRFLRYEEVDSRGVLMGTVGPEIPAAAVHGGGAVRFGPDGRLVVTTGEAGEPWSAQDPGSFRGKVLLLDAEDHAAAESESFPTSASVYAAGLRNPQGVAWLPTSGAMVVVDHGPTGLEHEDFRTDLDEVNVVRQGDNLGWPVIVGTTSGGGFVSPIAEWATAIAPAGVTVVGGDSEWAGDVLVTGLRGAGLARLEIDDVDGDIRVTCREMLFQSAYGRLRLIRAAPDGTVWVGTSNRDHRGVPREGDDMILRIHPPVSNER